MIKEFKAFILRGNVVDLSVGFIMGASFGKIVTSLVNDVLMPPIGFLVGGIDFSELSFTLKSSMLASAKPVTIKYGSFINTLIDFLIVAFCVFLLVKAVNLLRKDPPPDPTEKNCPQCQMSIPIAAKRCGHCTSALT